jgi:hypothetical protein
MNMIDLFSVPMILLYAVFYGMTMKVADLMNEHNLKWFKYSNLLFGVAWGLFGALLILSNPIVANIILAMNIAFLIRRRIDYLNHAIAVSVIIIAFLFCASIDITFFLVFYFIFLIFGGLKDYVDDILKKRKTLFFTLNEAMLYYPIPTLVYCLIYGNWIVFYVFLLYTVFYDLTKYYGIKHGYR